MWGGASSLSFFLYSRKRTHAHIKSLQGDWPEPHLSLRVLHKRTHNMGAWKREPLNSKEHVIPAVIYRSAQGPGPESAPPEFAF